MLQHREGEFGLKRIYSKISVDSQDDLVFRNHALFELGSLYLEKCDFPNAVDCLEKVKTESLQLELYDNYFRSTHMLLRIHAERLDFDRHESVLKEAIQVGSSLSSFGRYQSKLFYNHGIAAMYKRDFVGARSNFEESWKCALKALQQIDLSNRDRDDLRRDCLNARRGVAVICKDERNYKEALEISAELHREILDFSSGEEASEHFQLHDLDASLRVLEGHCYRYLGQYQKALDKYWEAHSLLKSHRNWSHYYYVLFGLGSTYLAMGNTERSQIFFDLIADAVSDLELNALKKSLERTINRESTKTGASRLILDRERKMIFERTLGEVQFERRFVLLEILYLLASQPGRVFTKEELVDRIWHESYNPMTHDSKVYTSISRLRKLIEPDFKRPLYILNERDGYAFNPTVQVDDVSQPAQFSDASRAHLPINLEGKVQ